MGKMRKPEAEPPARYEGVHPDSLSMGLSGKLAPPSIPNFNVPNPTPPTPEDMNCIQNLEHRIDTDENSLTGVNQTVTKALHTQDQDSDQSDNLATEDEAYEENETDDESRNRMDSIYGGFYDIKRRLDETVDSMAEHQRVQKAREADVQAFSVYLGKLKCMTREILGFVNRKQNASEKGRVGTDARPEEYEKERYEESEESEESEKECPFDNVNDIISCFYHISATFRGEFDSMDQEVNTTENGLLDIHDFLHQQRRTQSRIARITKRNCGDLKYVQSSIKDLWSTMRRQSKSASLTCRNHQSQIEEDLDELQAAMDDLLRTSEE